jgi:hypothetical protein
MSTIVRAKKYGWDVYITHASEFYETKGHPISEADWLAVVSSDSTLQLSADDYYDRREGDGTVKRYHPFVWTEHPDRPPLFFMDGAAHCPSPDEQTMIKMMEIARKLGAKVLDEDGKTYSTSDSGDVIWNQP